jgi:hypothetical protein
MRILTRVTALLLLAWSELSAQHPTPVRDSVACTYDACALRVEGRRVLRGASGQPVLSLGMWGASPLAPYAATSDSAASYAAEFDHHYTPGTRWMTIGLLSSAVMGAVVGATRTGDVADRELAATLGGIALSFGIFTYGNRRVDRAFRALSRAIWWTNRDLPR